MPISTRPSDTFTRDNLLVGFSIIEFEPALTGGGYGAVVPLGILSSEALQKSIETIALERGDSGFLSVDREVVSRLELNLQLETFNFRQDIAQYIFASSTNVPVVADATASVSDDPFNIPTVSPFDSFANLANGSVDESTVAITCDTVTDEAVGTGDGSSGNTQGDFALDYKIKAIGDVTGFTVGGVDKSGILVAGSTPTSGQIAIEVGEEDSVTTGSGAITFGTGEIPALGAAIVATYKPSFSGADFTLNTDFVTDPTLGRVRMLHAGADASPLRLTGDQQPLLAAYDYNRKSGVNLKPYSQNQFDGRATIKHWTDIGLNFTWTIPSATILITDDDLTFGAEDFATATIRMNVNDAGGSDRFGTLFLANETQANS